VSSWLIDTRLARPGTRLAPRAFVETRERPQPRQIFSAENYALFEERAKRRRVQHRLAAAQAALARFRLHEAAAALEEIRRLDPDLPELEALAGELEAARRSRTARRLGTWAIAAGVILAAWALRGLTTLPPSQTTRTAIATPPAPVTIDKRIVVPSNAAVDAAPAATMASLPAPVAAARQTLAVSSGTLDTTGAATKSASAPARRPSLDPAEFVPVHDVHDLIVPVPPAPIVDRQPASVLSAPVPVTPSSSANLPAAATTAPLTDDADLVRQVLQQYRAAYQRLDAASARAVWPGVNEEALARAFGDLESQTLTFQNCDVRLDAAEATATCLGTARYVPKVGGRVPRVEPRRWSFTLRRFGSDWRIETARAER
jgi:hypothetical protein